MPGGKSPGSASLGAGNVSATGSMAMGRSGHTATRLANGQVLIAGGSDERDWNGQTQTAGLFDPARERRKTHTVVLLPQSGLNSRRFCRG